MYWRIVILNAHLLPRRVKISARLCLCFKKKGCPSVLVFLEGIEFRTILEIIDVFPRVAMPTETGQFTCVRVWHHRFVKVHCGWSIRVASVLCSVLTYLDRFFTLLAVLVVSRVISVPIFLCPSQFLHCSR